jgi:MinD-like ATPase involved in chromosome partitioning or flagellar assembly
MGKNMNVVILNYCGTVGKTTLAANLLMPKMPGATLIAVESINNSTQDLGMDTQTIRGERFIDLYKKLPLMDNAVIDVGASNVEDFIHGLVNYHDAHEDIDYFIVPSTNGTKEMAETVRTIEVLAELGIPAEKIHLVFNRVKSDVEEEFKPLFNYAKQKKKCSANPEAAVIETEIFDLLGKRRTTLQAVKDDPTDFRAKIKELANGTTAEEKKAFDRFADLRAIKGMSKTIDGNLDCVYQAIFGK